MIEEIGRGMPPENEVFFYSDYLLPKEDLSY
jgi:hypothetical protein